MTFNLFIDGSETVRDAVKAQAVLAQPLVGDMNDDDCVNIVDLLLVRNRLGDGSGCP